MKRNQLGSKKEENLVYIHSTLCLLFRKDPKYKKGSFNRWYQYTNDTICVDKEIQLDGLVEQPPISTDEQEPQLKSDAYLESMLSKDLSDVDDNEDTNVAVLVDMA